MTISQKYAVAAEASPVVVSGVRLLPLTLGHRLLLERYGSPFILNDRTPRVADLALAQIICSRPWRDAQRLIRTLRGRMMIAWRSFCIGQYAETISCMAFINWMAANERHPEVWRGGGRKKGKPLNIPFWLEVQLVLQSKLHKTEEEVLEMSLGKAFWQYSCLAALDGHVRLKSDADYKFEQESAEEAAKIAEEEEAARIQAETIENLQGISNGMANLANLARKGATSGN